MATAAKPQTQFGRTLRTELDRHTEIKSLRKLGHVMRPDAPETARRALAKWISGEARPTPSSRLVVATALGVDPSVFSEDDDEEDAELMDALTFVLRQVIRQELERVRA